MSIQFNCPSCKKTLKAPDEKAGAYVNCPGCQAFFPVPHPQGGRPENNLVEPSAPPAISIAQWYYLQNQQQIGPVSLNQLCQLASSGQLAPSDMVWKQGMAEWTPAANVGELSVYGPSPLDATAGTTKWDRQERVAIYDELMSHMRGIFTARLLESSFRFMTLCGDYGITAAMVFSLLFAIIVALKSDSLSIVLYGFTGILLLSMFQYTARRMFGAIDVLIKSTPSRMSSTAFLDCFALLNLFLGVVGLAVLMVIGFRLNIGTAVEIRLALFLGGTGVFLMCEFLACIALNPSTIGVSFSQNASAGEDAVGVMSIFMKIPMRFIPVAFALGIVLGNIGLLVSCLGVMKGGSDAAGSMVIGPICFGIMLGCASLPFFGYLQFNFFYLGIDVMRSILVIPGKLDKLREANEKTLTPVIPPNSGPTYDVELHKIV